MLRYVFTHVLRYVLLLIAVSFVTFFLVSVSPIDPVQANVGQAALITMSPEKRAQLEDYWGVNQPLWERYGNWVIHLLHGDWGTSLRYNEPVLHVIAQRSLNSLALLSLAWVVSGVLGFVLGVVAGANRGKWFDRLMVGYCFLLASMPTFWIGLIFLMIFSVWLGWFPIGFSVPIGVASSEVGFWDILRHLALPALTLSFVGVANIALHTREKTIDVIGSEYLRFAQARGESKARALMCHGLRNLALPAITLQFASIAEIFGGSVLVETVFSYPGLGQAAVTAGLGGDVELLAAIALISAILVFSGNLFADLIYGVVDPRIRLARRTEATHE